jgi:nucleotide-binding universal stress UspA family protein
MPEINSILVPLDGSGLAETALQSAMRLAHRFHAAIHVVRVHQPVAAWDAGAEILAVTPGFEELLVEGEETYLMRIANRIRAEGLAATGSVLTGNLVTAIREYAETHRNDMVVMASHGRGGIRRAMLGSVADSLVRSLTMPVLIVTPRTVSRMTSFWPSRILVPLDGSTLARAAVDQVKALDPLRQAKILLTSVVQTMPPELVPWAVPPQIFHDDVEAREGAARQHLAEVASELRQDGFKVYSRNVTGTKVAREILKLAIWKQCDLIVMATHGAGGIDRVMFGSVTEQVLRHSNIPVMVVRPETLVRLPAELAPACALTPAGAT